MGESFGDPGVGDVVLAPARPKSSRRNVVILVVLLILVVGGGAAYVISKKSNSTPTAAPPASVPSATADVALAARSTSGSPIFRLVGPRLRPAQAAVRPPVAPVAAQATAANAMASCLATSYAVVSGLFDSGSLPGQTGLVQSPMFQSAAGTSLQMALAHHDHDVGRAGAGA